MADVQQIIGPFGWAYWFQGPDTPAPVARAYPSAFRVSLAQQPVGRGGLVATLVSNSGDGIDATRTTAVDL